MSKIVGAGVIFVNAKGQILMLRRHERTHQGGSWGLVGGRLGPGELPVVRLDPNESTEYAWMDPAELRQRDDLHTGIDAILDDFVRVSGHESLKG